MEKRYKQQEINEGIRRTKTLEKKNSKRKQKKKVIESHLY